MTECEQRLYLLTTELALSTENGIRMLNQFIALYYANHMSRKASLTWSVPVSNGYGRRIRYLVWDVAPALV
jgi:hypothetical protein